MSGSYTPLWPEVQEVVLARQPAGYKPRLCSGWWHLHSPLRDDDEHPSFAVKPDSEDDPGAFKDFATDEHGSLAELASRMGIDPRISGNGHRAGAAGAAGSSPPTLEGFCAQRRLDRTRLCTTFGVRCVTWYCPERKTERPALRYPTPTGVDRLKFTDCERPKYVWARKGGRRHWYGLEHAAALGGVTLYLVNGEPSVWACILAGVPAVCLCGGEANEPPAELVAELRAALVAARFIRVAVVYDHAERHDLPGQGSRAVATALRKGGIGAHALALPPSVGVGGDVDVLHQQVGAAGLADALGPLPILGDEPASPGRCALAVPRLHDAALYGLAGDVVRCISPHSEAHEAALLATFLLYVGNLVGRAPHDLVGEERHGTNLFCCLVGRTSGSRKGTSRRAVEALIRRVEPDWLQERVLSGLSSGQGLIHEVRDPVEKTITDEDGNQKEVVDDEGAGNKRVVVVEEEFCAPIKMMGGESNILSAVMRQAWDGQDLATLTRHSPLRATGPHISILGHSTQPELRKYLTETEMGNGFANRFLWVYVERSKELADGGGRILWGTLVKDVHDALARAQRLAHAVERDEDAWRLWHHMYPRLTQEREGMWGAITARAAPQVLRLSVIYALLDQSAQVRRPHLEAALALWQYCEESARVIFGEGTGNRTADRMLAALRGVRPKGLTSTQLTEALGYNVKAAAKDAALDLLLALELIRSEPLEGKGGGRVYYAL